MGKPKSGKTGLVTSLIAEFKSRGYRVAAVKHAHETVELDIEGKDTWRFAEAGSDTTAVSSPGRLTIFRNVGKEPTVEEALDALGGGYDLVLLEGFKKFKVPRIEVSSGNGEDLVCSPDKLLAVITDEKLPYKLPQFGRKDIKAVADFIEKEIIAGAGADLSVFVNGRQVFLKPFVKDIIGRAILGMISALKNVGIIRTVNISLRAGKSGDFETKEE